MEPAVRIERTRNRHSRAVLKEDVIVVRLARGLNAFEEKRHIDYLVRRMVAVVQKERERVRIDPYFDVSNAQKEEITQLVHAINARTLNVSIRSVRLRAMRSQWGSCSPNGDIALNTGLLKVPYRCMEYVIIHELAHRVYGGHGPRFWALVEKHCPEVARLRKELRGYRVSGA
jgi:predicted metal-dependent hydrolase